MRDPLHATIFPGLNSGACEVQGCEETELLSYVDPEGDAQGRALCPQHRVEYLREVSSQ